MIARQPFMVHIDDTSVVIEWIWDDAEGKEQRVMFIWDINEGEAVTDARKDNLLRGNSALQYLRDNMAGSWTEEK